MSHCLEPWFLTFGLLVVCALAAFSIGLVVGADLTRARLLKQLRQQACDDDLKTFRSLSHE
ncbi:MAG TPA: hypothetical protein VL494_13480 [Steroidobacteraceae bacterium]|jgi:hypothetical protein|nr:hypothetical protein [Steroidobacteraceae bacterium]